MTKNDGDLADKLNAIPGKEITVNVFNSDVLGSCCIQVPDSHSGPVRCTFIKTRRKNHSGTRKVDHSVTRSVD